MKSFGILCDCWSRVNQRSYSEHIRGTNPTTSKESVKEISQADTAACGHLHQTIFTSDRNGSRTPVISHVNQEIGDSGRLEVVDSSLYISWELIVCIVVGLECADKHLKRAQIIPVINGLPLWGGRRHEGHAQLRSYFPGERRTSSGQYCHPTVVE